jgi:hypothetical protein
MGNKEILEQKEESLSWVADALKFTLVFRAKGGDHDPFHAFV